MKKILALSAILFICVSATFAAQHPLIGKWKFRYIVGGGVFYDYVTIATVNTKTKKVSGYLTGLSNWKLTGYYNGNIVFIADNGRPNCEVSCTDYYMDGYYFTFQGTTPLKKHLSIHSSLYDLNTSWHSLTTTKLSDLIVDTEILTLDDILNQKALKQQAQLRERMMLKPPR